MQRRQFLAGTMASLCCSGFSLRAEDVAGLRITRIVSFSLPTQRSKVAGKNSHKEVHGDRSQDRMVRISTNSKHEGLGNCRASQEELQKLLGTNPLDWIQQDPPQSKALGNGSMPLWDLAGKLLAKPAYDLFGGAGEPHVPVYDGSIYFADLLPQYESSWRDRFRQEVDMALALGHRAVKVKVGRGFQWMPREDGNARDVEVLQIIRQHAGDDFLIGIDANNGYDLAGTKEFLDKIGDANLAFVEEMFPETVDECLELKRFIASRGWKTYVADGESQANADAFVPFVAARAIDVLQGDMNRFGFEGILAEAELAKSQDLLVAPHNWGSLVGYYMQLHIGRAITNFYRAEHDPLQSDVLVADGYSIADGRASVPDAPGFGLHLNEDQFASQVRVHFDIKG